MELRQLRYFVAVAEDGNISRAAQRIFLTQPALSRQIKALEEELGQCLLERRAHSIRLTPAGERLLPEARELLQRADEVIERVRAAGRGLRLRVGYAPSLASGVLSVAVANFTQLHPGARVELLDCSTAAMREGLERETLEVALCVAPARPAPGLQWTPLWRAPWRLAVNRNHALARRARVSAGEAAREPVLMYGKSEYPEYWERITGWFAAQGQRPGIAGEYDGAENLMAAVESGLGVALVTTQMAKLYPNRVRLLTLAQPPEPVAVTAACLARRAEEKPLAVFIEELRKAAK